MANLTLRMKSWTGILQITHERECIGARTDSKREACGEAGIPKFCSLQQRLLEVACSLVEGEKEGGAAAELAGRPNSATVALNEMLNDGEAKSRAALFPGARFVHAIETLKDPLQGFRRYARAVILDEYFHRAAFPGVAAHGDGAIGAAVLDGVIHQVPQHLFQPVNVSAHGKIRDLVEIGRAS